MLWNQGEIGGKKREKDGKRCEIEGKKREKEGKKCETNGEKVWNWGEKAWNGVEKMWNGGEKNVKQFLIFSTFIPTLWIPREFTGKGKNVKWFPHFSVNFQLHSTVSE